MQFSKNKNQKKSAGSKRFNEKLLEAMVMTAIFTAMAVALKSVTKITIPLMGAGGMSISFAGIFSFFPAILYGPLYGGASSALCDFLGWVIKPDGPYNPLFTIVGFLGGCLKGIIWMGISKGLLKKRAVKSVLACLFALFIITGAVFTVSLNSDGVITGVVAIKEELPMKDAMQKAELSPISRLAVDLARYNKDTITLTEIKNIKQGVSIIPESISDSDGNEIYKVTKVSASVFNTEGLSTLYFPIDHEVKIDTPKDFVLTNKDIVLVAPSAGTMNPTVAAFAEKHGVRLVTNDAQYSDVTTAIGELSLSPSSSAYSFKATDTYRKYLAGYINLVTLALLLAGALGLFIMLIAFIITKVRAHAESERAGIYLRVLPTVLLSGLVVTTINTFVLLETVITFEGRSFLLFYIPRFAEEVLVSVIQAYVITVLITALSANKTLAKFLKI